MVNESPSYNLNFQSGGSNIYRPGTLEIKFPDGGVLNVRFEYQPQRWTFSTTNETLYPLEIVAEKDGKSAKIRRQTEYSAGYPVNFYLFDRDLGKPSIDDRTVVAQMMREAQRGRPSLRDYVDDTTRKFGADIKQLVGQEQGFREMLSDLRTHLSDGVTQREYLQMLTGIFESDEMRGLLVRHLAASLEARIGDLTEKVKPLAVYQTEFESQLVDMATEMVREQKAREFMRQHIRRNVNHGAITEHQGLALYYVMENLFNRNAGIIRSLEAKNLVTGRMMTPEENWQCNLHADI